MQRLTLRRVQGAALALSILLAAPPPAAGQLCQAPLSIQKGDVDANIMILLDNSGSMNEVVEHEAYDEDATWSGGFTPGITYMVGTSGWYTINDRSAYLVSGPNGEPGRYFGEYLNWIYWYADSDQRASLPTLTKLDVAQTVIKDFVGRATDVFLGLAVFDYDAGAQILAECGEDPDVIRSRVDAVAGTAWTPLGEAMEDLLDYFRRTDDGAPIQYDCQQNFIIVVTDGLPTRDRDVSPYLWDADGDGHDPGDCTSIGAPYDDSFECSDHVDDVAFWLRHNDLVDWLGEPDEPWEDGQTVVTYTVGYDVDHPLLAETAANGDGLYLPATDAAELVASLEAIMINVRQRVAAGSAVAVVSSESADTDWLYRGKYKPTQWMGFVECFAQPYRDMEAPVWEAGAILAGRDASSRTIYSYADGGRVRLDPDNATRVMDEMGLADVVAAADVITWTLGDPVDGLRRRDLDWKLGDVVHAAPVVVGAPSFYTADTSFQDFMDDGAVRDKMLYVAANDGMLHAFRAADGHEAWAYVPAWALPMLPDIADTSYCHRFSIDLTPGVCDAVVGGRWRTVLVGGAREGGPGYFALDVTDPDDPGVLWHMQMPDGLAWGSEVAFARLGGRDVVLLGSGLDTVNGRAQLHEFDLATGQHLGSLLLSSDPGERNKATTPTPLDLDFDDETDVAYIGDLLGTVHRIAFNGSASPGAWSVTTLYTGDQPVQAQPRAAYGEGGLIHVYFGTGAYLEEPDILTTDRQAFYCIFDRHDGHAAFDLVDQSGSVRDIGDADGWYIELDQKRGERVTEPAAIAAGIVFFTSYAPFDEPCRSGGESFFYRLEYDDGAPQEDADDDAGLQNKFRGGGIASRPVLDIVNGTVIIQSSNQTITVEEIGRTYGVLDVRAWQEDFDHVEPAQPADPQ